MKTRRLHRRLTVLMGVAGLVAFAGGAGFEPGSAVLAGIALLVAFFWQPDDAVSERMERLWLPLAALLVLRALYHVIIVRDDVVIPVVDLLLLLLSAESLRSLRAPNDLRLYALSFALILASTAYRPGILFLIAFVVYIVLATVALMIGHLQRRSRLHSAADPPLDLGMVLTTTALSGVILATALAVFVAFPRGSQGWAGRGETMASSIAGFSDQVSIGEHGSTILGNPEIVLRVEFPDAPPANIGGLHWRGRSYDRFDGVRWTRSQNLPPSAGPTSWYRSRWGGDLIEQRIFGSALESRVLFALHPALDIEASNGVQPIFDNAGDFVYWGRGAPAYTAYSPAEPPSSSDLRQPERGYRPSSEHYLQLPRSLDPRIRELADSLVRGTENRYDQAVALRDWLQTFEYTRQLPATAREATLAHFLFERRAGHCEYFSTAMVVMLRSLGIEARNVNGFLGGQWSTFGDYLVVTQNEAHSWVEAWFPGFGWVTFDPTPAGVAGTQVTSTWFWPGRILFDGIQHRWSKWVLDYSIEEQSGILAGLVGERSVGGASDTLENADVERRRPFWAVALLVAIGLGWLWARRPGPSFDPATRMYLQLRRVSQRAGLPVGASATPEVLLRRIEDHQASAATPAALLVDRYQRARFGNEALATSELNEMQDALDSVRSALRHRRTQDA